MIHLVKIVEMAMVKSTTIYDYVRYNL